MSQLEAPAPRRATAVGFAALGSAALAVGVALGPRETFVGAAILIALAALAMREMATPTFTWANAVSAFILVMWLVPARGYRLPITLPFNLEPYRLVLAVLLFALVVALFRRRASLEFLGFGAALAIVAVAATVSAVLNAEQVVLNPDDPGAVKSLSYFLGFLAVFVLIASTIKTQESIDTCVRAFVVGAAIVAASAVYESRAAYNLFDHLDQWIPALVREERTTFDARGGSLRVYASAQHPIALSAALFMAFPLAFYLVGRASTKRRAQLWVGAAGICAMGGVATISRTTVIMGGAVLLVALYVRRRLVLRFWPLLLILPFAMHFAVPGALGGIYKAFFPEEGLAADLGTRPGEAGSGRFADVEPGLRLWSEEPLFGQGQGRQLTTAEAGTANVATGARGAALIFDNQWLATLVTMGFVGLLGTAWFVWGSLGKLAAFARRVTGPRSDLAAACAASVGAFGMSMFVFDAFAFVQATLVFFIVAALGLQARRLGPRPLG